MAQSLKALATELYKIKNGFSPEILTAIFAHEYHGCESISFLGRKMWNILLDEIKQQTSLNSFKKSVKKWKLQDCPCRLCKVYINGVGFLSHWS